MQYAYNLKPIVYMIIMCAVNFKHWQSFICCLIQSAFPCQLSCVYLQTCDLTVTMIYRPLMYNEVCESACPTESSISSVTWTSVYVIIFGCLCLWFQLNILNTESQLLMQYIGHSWV